MARRNARGGPAECAGPLGRNIGGVRRDRKINKLELEYELELKVQHAARGTADFIASRIPPGQG